MTRMGIAVLLVLATWTSTAQAQRREHEGQRYRSDHCKEGWKPVPAAPPGAR